VSSCAEQAKKAAKTFGIATDCDTHESVGHLLIYVLSLQTLWKSSEITSHAFFRSLLGLELWSPCKRPSLAAS
jgi:hypothetical protein